MLSLKYNFRFIIRDKKTDRDSYRGSTTKEFTTEADKSTIQADKPVRIIIFDYNNKRKLVNCTVLSLFENNRR